MLVARVGAERVRAESEAATDLISFCAGYPLALGIVAGRAISSPIDDGDAPTSLSTVLSWSYRALTAEQASVFGLLGLMPGPDISLSAAASLLDRPEADTARLLRELTGVSLLQRHVVRRYRMHDMIRLYAAEQAHRGSRRMALRRLVDHYARAADEVLGSAFSEQDSPAEQQRRDAEAWAWLDEERSCLEAAQALAIKENLHRAVWKLARALDTYYYRRGHVDDQLAVCEAGLSAARRLGNADSQARAHRLLGVAYTRAGSHDDAVVHLDQAMAFAVRAGNQPSQAKVHQALARVHEKCGDHQLAHDHARAALDLYAELGNPAGQARALNQVGWSLARLGRHLEAQSHCDTALASFRRRHDGHGQADTLDSLGYIAHLSGRPDQAVDYYRQAIVLFHNLDDAYHEADTLSRLGHAHLARGEHEQARAAWVAALRLYEAQRRTEDAEAVRQLL